MKFINFFLVILAICGFVLGFIEEPYPSLFDQVDVDTIFSNDRLFNQYVHCLLDEGPCTADGRSIRQLLPEILVTQCARCTEHHRKVARKIFQLRERKPDLWTKFQKKYDPDDIYISKLEEILKEY